MGTLISILPIGLAIWWTSKESEKSSDEPLSLKNKILVFFLCIFSPIINGAIMYYSLKAKFPKKAKQVNGLSMWAFLMIIIVVVGFMVIVAYNAK